MAVTQIDASIKEQLEAIVEAKLIQYGLIDRGDTEMTREEAERKFLAFLEKGRSSGRSPISHDEFWKVKRVTKK